MKTLEELEPKEVAEDFYIGNTHVRIATDYCRPREEVPEILRRISRIVQSDLTAQYIAEQRKANEEKAS